MVVPILLYRKHEIDEELGTPIRNHVKFPGMGEQKRTFGNKKFNIGEKRQKQTSEFLGDRKKIDSKTRVLPSEESHQGRTTYAASKQSKKSTSALKVGGKKNTGKLSFGSSTSKKVKGNDASRKEQNSPMTEENKSLGNRLFELANLEKPGKQYISDGELNKAAVVNPATKKLSSDLPPLDADRERRFLLFPLIIYQF